MNNVDFDTAQPLELAEMFTDMSTEDIQLFTSHLNPEQLTAVIAFMNEKNTPKWREKTRAIILGLANSDQVKVAGSSLSVPQILDFFESNLLSREDNFNKLLIFLVGMTHQTFSQLLYEISESQLQALLQTSFSEPLQHQLTIFNHEMSIKYQMMNSELDKLFNDIQNLSVENLGRNELIDIKNQINDQALDFNKSLEKIRNGLRIAWNTNRFDLIENLNSLKNKYLHTLLNFIGHPMTLEHSSTGLYGLLEDTLSKAFGKPFDLNDPESLNNDEPSLEALVKFSIWYLKDYWEVGLLPKIKKEVDLGLDPNTHSEQECLQYRDLLFSEVQHNLEKLHLRTVRDLKKAHIYSKKALIEYLQENNHHLS